MVSSSPSLLAEPVRPADLPSPLERCRKEDRQPHWLTRILRKVLGYPPLPMPIKGQQWVSQYSGEVERISDVRVDSGGSLVVEVQAWFFVAQPGIAHGGLWGMPSAFRSLESWHRHIVEERRVRCIGFTDQ